MVLLIVLAACATVFASQAGVASASAPLNLRGGMAQVDAVAPAVAPTSNDVGTWEVEGDCSGSPCFATVTISIGGQEAEDPACSPGVYCVSTLSGGLYFYGEAVSISPGSSGSWTYNCNGCRGKEKIQVTFEGNKFTGTGESINEQGVGGGGTAQYDGVLASGGSGPELSIAGTTVAEPASGTNTANFPVTLSQASKNPVSVDYTTQDGTGSTAASAPRDYQATQGTLTFSPGETSQSIPVTVNANGVKGKRQFSVSLSNPSEAEIGAAEATGTIVGSSPLRVTIAVPSPEVDIQQNEAGPIPQNVTATVTVRNTGGSPIEHVTLPANLMLGWHGPVPINALPIKQTGAPATLDLGTIAPGASSRRSEYTIQVEGDGHFDIQALVTGSEGSEAVHALGTKTIEPTSQLLVMKNALGAFVHGQNNPSLVRAGTHFLVKAQLENRSYVNRLQVEPYYPELSGNALGGQLVPESEPTTYSNPTGALGEVKDSPAIVLAPREKRIFSVVVGTAASDAFSQKSTGGGTRATIKFETPEVSTLDEADEPTVADDDRTVLTPGSEEVQVGIDDSVAVPPPFDPWQAEWAVAKGVGYGLWGLTYGTVKGFYDLAAFGVKSVLGVPAAVLNEVGHMSALWRATEKDPAARQALLETVVMTVYKAYNEAPWLLAKAGAEMGMSVPSAVEKLVSGYFTRISNEWYAGNWEQAITDVSETGTNVVGLFAGPAVLKAAGLGPATLRVAAGTLVRAEPVEAAWVAEEAATAAKTEEALGAASEAVEPAETAVEKLGKAVRPGYPFSLADLQQFFGISPTEANYLSDFTNARKISVVLRSRAEESLKWLKEGAMLKPYWIKAKTVTWADVQFLGYDAQDVGRVVMREPPTLTNFEAKLAAEGIGEGTPQYQVAVERLQQRTKGYAKEIKEMEEWNRRGTVKGKWPWQENGVNPLVQSDEESTYAFRLLEDPDNPGARVPQIFNPRTGQWGSITGDVDLIAITKADGSALSDADQVQYLKELRNSLLETQHPESLTWIQGEKFWFPAKEDYLNSKDLVQFGPDGGRRAVTFNADLSKPEDWTKLNYRVIWDGGYQVGPGQVP